MTNFDVVTSISQAALTSLSQEIYAALYPQVFSGDFPFQSEGTNFTVNWDVKVAPVLNLATSDEASAAAISFWNERVIATHLQGLDLQHLTPFLETLASVANCSAHLPQVVLTIKTPGMKDATLTLDVTTYCFAQIINNQVTLIPTKLIAAHQSDPLYDMLVQKFLLPALLPLMRSHLASLSIPSINIEGIALSPLSLVIENGHVVAAANLAAKGTPPQPSGTLWTNAGLSVLLSQDALQAGVAYGISQANASSSLHDSGSSETLGFGYYWGYSCSLGTPGVTLAGSDLNLTLPVNASVWGGGIIAGQHVGVDYEAKVQPTPRPVFSIATSENHIQITFKGINTLVILLQPSGNVAQQIAGWMLAGIVNSISTSFSTILTTFVKNISFPLITVPSFSPTIGSITFTITPSNLTLSNLDNMLALGGSMTITKR